MIRGDKTGLRAVEQKDLNTLLEWRNIPDLRKYFREYRELNTTQQSSWFNEKVNGDISTRMFSIIDLSNDDLLGACGLCYIDWINRSADFSIYLGKDEMYIDHDYAPDAARVLIKYAFEELQLHRLWAEIYSFDTAKSKFFSNLGFFQDGVHRKTHWTGGDWCDSLFYSLLSSDLQR